MPVYLYAVGRILEDLAIAIIEAKAELPEHLRWEQEQLSRTYQVVDTWREVQRQYCLRNQKPDWQVVDTLEALNLFLECKAKLEALIEEADVPEPNLTLGKMRR
jgi:hypothetical protein